MGRFLGWLGGILATVIAGYVLWYITRPTVIEGMVIDRSQNVAVEKALVTVEIPSNRTNGPFDSPTDSNGSYAMELSGLGWRKDAVVHVRARGFRDSPSISVVLVPGGNRKDFFLEPISVPASPSGTSATHPVATGSLPVYIRSSAMARYKIQSK
jgi:hypothetical protein